MNINERMYKVFLQNDVLFTYNINDLNSSVESMLTSFDLYYYKDDYLWYRLKKKVNMVDKYNILYPHNNEVNIIRLFDNDIPLKNIETLDSIDEKTFYKYRDQGRLDELLYDDLEADISYSHSSYDSELEY